MNSLTKGWLKEMDSFLPCFSVDYQEFLPLTDFLLDDFNHVEAIEEIEDIKPAGECTIGKDEVYLDLMDSTYIEHQKDFNPLTTDLSNEQKIIEKYDKECFQIVDNSGESSPCLKDQPQNTNCNDDLPSSSENAISLSSAVEIFTSELLTTSRNETFSDLSMFLEKEHASYTSIDLDISKEDSISTNTDANTTVSPADSEVCFSTICSTQEESEQHTNSIVYDSDVDSDSDESWEPSRKKPKLNKSSTKLKSNDVKYVEMRRKNNVASQRSRQSKKLKEKEMEEKAVALEKENESLRIKEKKLQELVDKLKEMLFSSVNKKK